MNSGSGWRPNCSEASLTKGRCLRFAPHWDCSDAEVLFDRNSGDYWVISSLAGALIKQLQTHGCATLVDLDRRLGPSQPRTDLRSELESTLQSLADSGLVQPASLQVPEAVSVSSTFD